MSNNHVVIMAGGVGSRFWPLSTPEYPKQFIDIMGCGRTLIQLTVDRFKGISPVENFWVVTNAKYVDIVKEQLPGIPLEHILAEPEARNTAPCIAWACWKIRAEDENANIVVTPSDAVVMNPDEFCRVIKNALVFTESNNAIVTVGIKPSRPETGYGYVQFAEQVEGEIHRVGFFKEKPNLETAKQYFADGHYLWNAGIFVWNVQTIVDSFLNYHSQIAGLMTRMAKSFGQSEERSVIEGLFPLCDKISIDYAVMEPASRNGMVYTHPADFGWSDLGNWASLYDILQKDENNNGAVGNIRLFECSNCVVHAEDAKRVVLQGLDDYIFSEKNGQILLCKRSEEQRIRIFSAE
ncbi:MAG: mannose-1-phosphate guanylyltransferase [Bacteroidales bacterium]|nr:mannose-1-phosphate guanylyltransferase [Bacteroidales bacterium]